MKLFAIILILSISVHQISAAVAAVVTTTTCKASNYCMGCSATVADQCTNCYNQVQNKIGMKQLDALTPVTCATAAVLKVTNSKQLDSTLTATSASVALTTIQLCDPVKGKWKVQMFNGDTSCAATTTLQDIAAPPGAAAAVGAQAMATTTLLNCQQHIAFEGTAAGVGAADQRQLCMYCKSGYCPTGSATDLAGFTDAAGGSYQCAKPTSVVLGQIPNCLFYKRASFVIPTGTVAPTTCLGCKAGFAAASDNQTCVAYTTDANCRVLQTTTTECNICKDAYYWDAKKCVLAAKMMIAGFAVVLSLVM